MSSTTTLTATIPQPRSGHASSRSSTPPTSTPQSPKSPSHNPRRPSISNTMHWLSRNATPGPSSQPYSPSKPVKISEPKRARTIDAISAPRNGTLGAGATVVRTPDEALRETGVRLAPQLSEKAPSVSSSRLSVDQIESKKKRPSTPVMIKPARQSDVPSTLMNEPISPPTSPPLPPIPLTADFDDELGASESEIPVSATKSPAKPTRAPPPAPSRRSSMKGRGGRTSTSPSEDAPHVPPLPPHIVASTQPPPFHALLVSEPPAVNMDPSKIIVTLETCTQSYKTTLSTIYSRASHLSTYFSTIFDNPDKQSTASMYSSESDDLAMYNRHLMSQGLLPPSINVHIFLDRPSAPYSHILSYLRSPVVEGQPEVLPRALQLNASTSAQSRLENLIEVRDEAAFLNLEGLHKLCSDEIRLRYGPRLHTRGNSASSGVSIHSLRASIYSLHTLLERVETDLDANNMPPPSTAATDATFISPTTRTKSSSPIEPNFPARSPPTPQSWDGPRVEQRSQSRSSLNRQTPPAGWI